MQHVADREDYGRFLAEYGFTEATVRAAMTDPADLAPLPPGFDALRLADSAIQGRGLFAVRTIEPGEVLAPARLDGRATLAGRFTNHAAVPNARFVRPDQNPAGDLYAVAVRRIEQGEEVTVSYRQAGEVNGYREGLEARQN